jgi:alanine racemase
MVVVKSNAYGHGLEAVAPVAAERADWLCDCLDEAWSSPGSVFKSPSQLTPPLTRSKASFERLPPGLVLHGCAKALSASAVRFGAAARVHLKIETEPIGRGLRSTAFHLHY